MIRPAFDRSTREVAALADRCPSVLIGATGRWYEALATTAIGQRVVRADAQASRTRLAKRFGTVFHGLPTAVFPTPDSILGIPDHDFHLAGVERSRARVVRVAAKHSDRLESLDTLTGADAIESLRRLPGVGPWTAGLDLLNLPAATRMLSRSATFTCPAWSHMHCVARRVTTIGCSNFSSPIAVTACGSSAW